MRMIISFFQVMLCRFFQWYYSIKVAETNDEKGKLFEFRYQIYIKELNIAEIKKNEIHANKMYDDRDFDNSSVSLYATKNNEIIGTIRISIWQKKNIPADIKKKFNLDDDILKSADSIGEIRFFQIAKKYRKSFLAVALVNSAYQVLGKNILTIPDILFSDTYPGLVHHYEQMGCYLYTKEPPSENIFWVALALNLYDINYHYKMRSSFRYFSTWYVHEMKKTLTPEQYRQKTKSYIDLIPHYPLYITDEEINHYKLKLQNKEKIAKYDFIVSLLKKKVILLSIKENMLILRKDMIDYDFFLLVEGELAVYIDDLEVGKLKSGDIFGEIAMLYPLQHVRHANIKAISDAKIIWLPRNLLSNLEKNDMEKANKLLHIICNSLAEKILHNNARLISPHDDLEKRNS